MGLFHAAYNGYVWKGLFPYRHPDRSGGIFLAHRYSVLCVTAEKGKPFAKEARKRGVRGRFLAAFEMRVWGNGFISRSVQRICLESAIPRNVIPSEAEGSFLHTGIASYVRQQGRGNLCERSKKEQSARKISCCARNDGRGNGFISRSVQRICLERTIPVSSSRAKSRDLSCTPV